MHVGDFCDICKCGIGCCCKCKCTCDKSHYKSYISREGTVRTILQLLLLILFIIEIVLYSYTISINNGPQKSCCGVIDYNQTACYYGDMYPNSGSSYVLNGNPYTMSMEHIDNASVCAINGIMCDSFTFKDTNTTIKLSDCISNSGYDINNICSDHTLNKYQYQSSIVIALTILNILMIVYMIWRFAHILLTHFGCLKEGHCNDCNGLSEPFTSELYYVCIDGIIGVVFIFFAPFFLWTSSFEYLNSSISLANEDTINENLDTFRGRSDIIWTEPIANVPWYLMFYGVRLWVWIIIFLIEVELKCLCCFKRELQHDQLMQVWREKSKLVKEKYPEKDVELQIRNTQTLSVCMSSDHAYDGEIICNCDYLQRLSSIMKQYEEITSMKDSDIDQTGRDKIVKLCTEDYYDGVLLDDIYHLQREHDHQYFQIRKEMTFKTCDLDNDECLCVSRHYHGKSVHTVNPEDYKYDAPRTNQRDKKNRNVYIPHGFIY